MRVKTSYGNRTSICGKRFSILFILILFFSVTNAQDYMYSSGYHVNTDVTGGNFYDGGGSNGDYGTTDDYTVTFIAPAGYKLIFRFTNFLVRSPAVLSVYDGLTTNPATKIGDFDDSNPIGDALWSGEGSWYCSPNIYSSGRSLTFHFAANGDYMNSGVSGWEAEIEIVEEDVSLFNILDEDGQTNLISSAYFFDDGDFIDRYGYNVSYSTTFQAPINHILKMTFDFFDVEGQNERLEVYDGAAVAGAPIDRFSAKANEQPATVYSTGRFLTFDWNSRTDWGSRRGWDIFIESILQTCGTYNLDFSINGTTIYTDCGTFYDDGGYDTDHGNNVNNTVTFCSNNGLPLTFIFDNYAFGGTASLNVYDGNSTAATQLDFTTNDFFDVTDINDKYITSSGSCLTFQFITGGGGRELGWESQIVTQPHVSNNDQCDATELTFYPARSLESYANIYATQSSVAEPSCIDNAYKGDFLKDVWFFFTYPDDGEFELDIESIDLRTMGAAIYTGSCSGSLNEEACSIADNINFDNTDIGTPLSAGDTIFVRVFGESGEAGSFNLGVYAPNAMTCVNANYYQVEKEPNLVYVEYESTGTLATPSCGGGNYSQYNDGVTWYKFTVPESQELIFQTQKGSVDNINFVVYSGDCGSLSEEICYLDADNADYIWDASAIPAGDTLRIAYWGSLNNNPTGSYQFSIHDPEPEGNGPCDAELFNVSGEENFLYYDNTGADDSGEPDPGCGWQPGDKKDMWFKFVAPEDGEAIVSTVGGSLTDIAVAVYSGTCSSLSLITCNTSGPGGEMDIQLTGLPAGDSIFVRVWGFGGAYGIYGLSISVRTPDGPCDANLLSVQEYSATSNYTFQGYSTTNNTATPSIAMPGCGVTQDAANDIDIWFNALVPASGEIGFIVQDITISTVNMAIYNGDDCSNPNYLQCSSGSSTLNIELTEKTPGDTIRVRIWGDYSETGYFEIAAYEPGSSLSIVGLDTLYCYSETVSNNNIVGSPLGGDFIPASGVFFKDNSDGTGVLYIGGDSTLWGDYTLKYALSGDTITENFRVAPSYLPTTDVDTISICDGETPASYTATGAAGATFYWFDTIPAPDTIYTGAVYTPTINTWTEQTLGSPIDTLNYYVIQEVESCVSDTTSVIYLIYKTPTTGPGYHIKNTWGE